MVGLAQGSDDFAFDVGVAFGTLGAEIGLVAGGAVVVLVLAEESSLGQACGASLAIEAPVVKVEIVDAQDFARTLFMAPLAIRLAQELERRLQRAQTQAFLLLFPGGLLLALNYLVVLLVRRLLVVTHLGLGCATATCRHHDIID